MIQPSKQDGSLSFHSISSAYFFISYDDIDFRHHVIERETPRLPHLLPLCTDYDKIKLFFFIIRIFLCARIKRKHVIKLVSYDKQKSLRNNNHLRACHTKLINLNRITKTSYRQSNFSDFTRIFWCVGSLNLQRSHLQ